MGQKVNPVRLRLGINRTWDSRWFAGSNYADFCMKIFAFVNFCARNWHKLAFRV